MFNGSTRLNHNVLHFLLSILSYSGCMPFAISTNNFNFLSIIKVSELFNTTIRYKTSIALKAIVHMLNKIICIMYMNDTSLMSIQNILWKQQSLCQFFGYLASHIIALDAVYSGVLITILLIDCIVPNIDDIQNARIGLFLFSDFLTIFTPLTIRFCYI